MPNLAPGHIHTALDTATRFGVTRNVLEEPAEWHRSGTTQRAALHVPRDVCSTAQRPLPQRHIEHASLAELAERNVCTCVGNHHSLPSLYLQVLGHIERLEHADAQLDDTPNWDLWLEHRERRRLYNAHVAQLAERNRAAARQLTNRVATIPENDLERLDHYVTCAARRFEAHLTQWRTDPRSARDWWERQGGGSLSDDHEHVIVDLYYPRNNAGVRARDLALACIAQYGVAHRDTTHVVRVPANLFSRYNLTGSATITRLGDTVDDDHTELLLELYGSGLDHDELLDTVLATTA